MRNNIKYFKMNLKAVCKAVQCTATGKKGFARQSKNSEEWDFFDFERFPNPLLLSESEVPTNRFKDKSQFTFIPAFFGEQIFAFAKNFSPLGKTTVRDRAPLMFIKPTWSVVGEDKALDLSELTKLGAKVWRESELAFIVGSDFTPEWVTIANDMTMHFPDLDQDNHLPYYKGQKNFLPLSSDIYPPEILNDYVIKSVSDDVVVREGGSDEIHYNPAEMIEWLKSWAVLKPSDLILVGSPLRFSGHTYVEAGSTFKIELNGKVVMKTEFV